ncbi:MAG: T9SS type B sorting domain-containing protein, partial [Bacteroidota bacterium]
TIYAQNAVNYSIDDGTTYLSDSIFYNLGAGSYMIMVQDAGNCTDFSIVNISQPTFININTLYSNVSCLGNDGVAQVNPTGGTSPYFVLWSNDSTDYIINNLSAGNYSVTVTDYNGCSTDTSFNIIDIGGVLTTSFINSIPVDCNGNSTGSVTVQTLGAGPFDYSWSNGDTTETISNVPAGIYYVTVTNALGCIGIDSISIIQPSLIVITDSVFDVTCGAQNGYAEIYIAGGTSPYSVLWSNDSTGFSISNIGEGTYYVTVTDYNSCTETYSLIVANTGGTLTTSITNIIPADCYGNSTGSATIQVNGTSTYLYNWSNGDTTTTISDVPAGTYYVTISDLSGCFGFDTVTIQQPAILSYNDSIVNVSCFGYNNGQIYPNITGGTPSYSYSWIGPNSFSSTNTNISNLSPGGYYVTVTDANGCSVSGIEFTVSEPEKGIATVIISNPPECNGDINGTAISSVTGGTPPYVYFWSNGDYGSSTTNLGSGEYYLTVVDANFCSRIDTFQVSEPALIYATESISHVSCTGNDDGSISLTVSGGSSPYSYLWNTTTLQTDSVLTDLLAGEYIVTITDYYDCGAIYNYTINDGTITCLEIPTFFSPNGDEVNDDWELKGIHIFTDIHVEIFNRWGDLIFSFDGSGSEYDNNRWDGTFNGRELPISSYIYILDLKNGSEPYNGIVTIKK